MTRFLLKSLLVVAIFVPLATFLPLAALSLCRTPDGATVLFFIGPWSAAFWVLIYSTLSAAPWREGGHAVREWREARGGLLHTSLIATGWMFGALFFSYVAEFAFLFVSRNGAWLPVATYSPLAFCWLWRKANA